jgi:hypothetical protein
MFNYNIYKYSEQKRKAKINIYYQMYKIKYSFNDIKIGDQIITTSGDIGTIIAIKSYAYLNDKFIRKSNVPETLLIDLLPFQNDNTKHRGISYATITLVIKDDKYNEYYVENIDFNEIKEVKRDMSNIKVTILDKLKKLFKL